MNQEEVLENNENPESEIPSEPPPKPFSLRMELDLILQMEFIQSIGVKT